PEAGRPARGHRPGARGSRPLGPRRAGLQLLRLYVSDPPGLTTAPDGCIFRRPPSAGAGFVRRRRKPLGAQDDSERQGERYALARCACTAANTARNISGVSLPVLVL